MDKLVAGMVEDTVDRKLVVLDWDNMDFEVEVEEGIVVFELVEPV